MRPTVALGIIMSVGIVVFLTLLLFGATSLSLAASLLAALPIGAAFFFAGLKSVKPGHIGVISVFGHPNQNGEDEYPEGYCWIYPRYLTTESMERPRTIGKAEGRRRGDGRRPSGDDLHRAAMVVPSKAAILCEQARIAGGGNPGASPRSHQIIHGICRRS